MKRPPVSPKQHRLLLVDDESRSRQSLSSILTISGFLVMAVASPDAALSIVRDGLEFCALLLNVSRPWAALAMFHAGSAEFFNSIPIISLCTPAPDASYTKIIGVLEVLPRPIDYGSLIAAIERRCRRSHPEPSIRVLLTRMPR